MAATSGPVWQKDDTHIGQEDDLHIGDPDEQNRNSHAIRVK